MRHPNDNIWGIWQSDNTSQQIWNQLQNKLDKHELKLDIVYEDPNYPATGKYNNIYYWSQKIEALPPPQKSENKPIICRSITNYSRLNQIF
jgi:adenine-specific DNA methylase